MTVDGHTPVRARLLRLVHHHPGRLRVRAAMFGNAHAPEITAVRNALMALTGVLRVVHNPQTQGLLVEYTPGIIESDAILAVTAEAAGLDGVFDEMTEGAEPVNLANGIIHGVASTNGVIRELTGGRADLQLLMPLAMVGAAVYSFAADKNPPRWPRWDNLAIWGMNLFVEWHRNRILEHGTPANDESTEL